MVERPTQKATEIDIQEYKKGSERVRDILEMNNPEIVCFVGLDLYRRFTGDINMRVKVGPKRAIKFTTGNTCKIFVMPSTSNLGAAYSHADKSRYVI